MGYEIINRVLKELNLEEYKSRFIDECMDDETMSAIVGRDDASFHRIIRKIIPTLGHAVKIRKKFKKLFSRNELDRSGSRERMEGNASSLGSSSGSSRTDSLLAGTRADQEKMKTRPASAESPAESSAPGLSTELKPKDGYHRNRDQNRNQMAKPPIPEVVGSPNNSGDGGALGFQSFQTPMARPVRKRKELPAELMQPASTPQESKKQVLKAKSNKTPRFNGV